MSTPASTNTSSKTNHELLLSSSAQSSSSRRLHLILVFGLTFISLIFYWREEDRLLQVLNTQEEEDGNTDDVTTTVATGIRDPESFWEPMSLDELTRAASEPNCTWPFVVVDNVLVEGDPFQDTLENGTTIRRRIPKQVHLAWISLNEKAPRQGHCLHHLQAETFDIYRKQFPDYSVYFHDDDAVDALLKQENWPEFPQMSYILQCMQMRGAMLVDIWRLLVTYKYGGFFADLDLWPTPLFNQSVIPPDVDFFTFSDSVRRPSQMAFAMAPGSPVGYTMVYSLLDSLYRMENIYKPALVFTTGPGIFAQGFAKHFFNWTKGQHRYIERQGIFVDHYGSRALKIGDFENDPIGMDTNVKKHVNGTRITYKDQIKKDTGVLHWTLEKNRLSSHPPMSCRHYLFELERHKARYPNEGTAKVKQDNNSTEEATQ